MRYWCDEWFTAQDAAEKAARARLSEIERLRRLHSGLDGRETAQVEPGSLTPSAWASGSH